MPQVRRDEVVSFRTHLEVVRRADRPLASEEKHPMRSGRGPVPSGVSVFSVADLPGMSYNEKKTRRQHPEGEEKRMNAIEAILTRRSTRNYSPAPVEQDTGTPSRTDRSP